MAYQLFIQTLDLKQLSALSGDVDDDKLKQFVRIAQDMHVKNYLGTDLFDRIQAGITAADLTAGETTLLNTYIKPMTVYWSLVEVVSMVGYTIANNGIYKRFAENSEAASESEIDTLIQKHRSWAEYHTRRFIDYMANNGSDFPQYTSNSGEDISPSKDGTHYTWQL